MRRLATVPDGFEAKLLAARLGADGIVCELRGGVDGMYPIGPAHVYVDERDFDTAVALLVCEDHGAPDDEPWEPARGRRRRQRWLLAAACVALAATLANCMAAATTPRVPAVAPPPAWR
jgi:hypothetical protein